MNSTVRRFVGLAAICGLVCAQDDAHLARGLEATVRSADASAGARIAALSKLQAMGQLDSGVIAEALSTPDLDIAAAAAAILRHEWYTWPSEVLDAALNSPTAKTAVLRELALAPRPSLDALVARCAKDSDPVVRALALSARQLPPTREEALWLLDCLAGSDERQAEFTVQRIAAADADHLVGALHARLLAGAPVSRIGAFLLRLSPSGAEQLLVFASSLDPSAASPLYDFLAQQRSPAFLARIAAMLDGEFRMEAPLLRRAGTMLDTPARRTRAFAWFEAAAAAPADEGAQRLALAAFDAAIDGRCMDAAVIDFAKKGGNQRLVRLVQGNIEAGAAAFLAGSPADLAAGNQGLWLLVAHASARRGVALPVGLDAQLRACIDTKVGVVTARDEVRVAAEALARLAGEDALPLLVRAAGADPTCARILIDALVRRADPVGAVMLRSLLADMQSMDAAAFAAALDAAELMLLESKACAAEDARCDGVFSRLASAEPAIIERLAAACPSLPDARWHEALAAFGIAKGRSKTCLGLWLVACPLHDALVALRMAHAAADDADDKLALYECLLRTKDRGDLVTKGMEAFGANPDADDDFLFAALSTAQKPLAATDLALIAWAMFEAPKRDSREAKRSKDPRPRGAFPEVAAIANLLLLDPENGVRAFDGASARVADAAASGVSRRRFLELWSCLQRDAALQDRVGRATAVFVLALPATHDAGEGAASLYAARDASSRGEHDRAEALFTVAIARLLRDPGADAEARVHLGVRAPLDGDDAYAALSAAPHLCRARGAVGPAAAKDALQVAREFAGRDLATLREIDAILLTFK